MLTPPIIWRVSSRARRIILRLDARKRAIIITMPPHAKKEDGIHFLQSQYQWLIQALGELPPSAIEQGAIPIEGDTTPILPTTTLDGRTRLTKDGIHIGHPQSEHPVYLLSFLKKYAQKQLPPIFQQQSTYMNAQPTKLSLRDVKSRWGSCSRKGHIMLNWRLIMAPRPIATYVITHELAHLSHFNHGPSFWNLVDQYTPGGKIGRKEAEKWLTQNGIRLLSMI